MPSTSSLNLRTTGAALLLALVLLAYTVQSELVSYVQREGGYKKPYFLFYITHSSYVFLLPLHLLTLRLLGTPIRPIAADVLALLADKYSPSQTAVLTTRRPPFSRHASFSLEDLREAEWVRELAKKVAVLTVFISAPALSWYGAVPLTNMTDITAIYNVFAFWAYLLSLYYLPSPNPTCSSAPTNPTSRYPLLSRLNPLDLSSVLLAVLGVFIIAYGPGSSGSDSEEVEGGNRLLGNSLALFGSVAYAGYEVYYKLAIALPSPSSDETPLRTLSRPTPSSSSAAPFTALPHDSEDAADEQDSRSETASLLSSPTRSPPRSSSPTLPVSPPSATFSPPSSGSIPTPASFLLYSTLLTSLIGLSTLLFLWLPLPLLHLVGWEPFELPPSSPGMLLALVGIAGGGMVFNGGFMVLLSLWGPVIASVSNLLTLLLVALADQLFMPSLPPITASTLVGGACIVGAFGGLIWGEWRKEESQENGEGGRGGWREGKGGEGEEEEGV